MSDNEFHNDGARPLFVPGFGGLPISAELPEENRFSHGASDWAQPNITAREIAMLQLMEALTDKPDWHVKIFNEDIVAKWRLEALSKPLISIAAWDWCVAELRDKARYFDKTGLVLVLNAGSSICKSDSVVSTELREELKRGVQPLLDVPDKEKDWHPESEDKGLNLVDPKLYPLVYGRTKVLSNGGQVDLQNPMSTCERGTVPISREDWAPDLEDENEDDSNHRDYVCFDFLAEARDAPSFADQEEGYWNSFSRHFQWLPCEVEFTGSSDTDVRITSYINNLQPAHTSLYQVIAKLISFSIEPWNQVLIKGGKGRWPPRIRTYGIETSPEFPEWASMDRLYGLKGEEFKAMLKKVDDYLAIPENVTDEQRFYWGSRHPLPSKWRESNWGLYDLMTHKHERLRCWSHPDAGISFNYQQWKNGDTSNPIVERALPWDPDLDLTDRDPDHEYYKISLQETYRTKGLQIFVTLASIELTPEKPFYGGDDWHIEGMINEHIVATAIYYYDVENVTEARLSFRQESVFEPDDYVYEDHGFGILGQIFAVPNVYDLIGSLGVPANQDLGSVASHEGRLVAWPNTLQHKSESFELLDKGKPGHRRFIVLRLVDPNYRLCSTRNVCPQQFRWWKAEALASVGFESQKVPPEIVGEIGEYLNEWPMGDEEAKRFRLELMKERSVAESYERNSLSNVYYYCGF